MRRSVIVGLISIAGLMPGYLMAHEGHKVMGTVTAFDANQLEVKDQGGKTVSIALAAETRYSKPGATAAAPAQGAAAADLKVGQRVVVSVKEEGAKMTATEVMLGAVEKPHAHGEPHQH